MRNGGSRVSATGIFLLVCCLLSAILGPAKGAADCINSVFPNSVAPFNSFKSVFPNWTMVPTSSFIVLECDDTTCSFCTSSSIVSLTIFNYGTATGGTGGDITNLYFQIQCGGKIDTGTIAMSFAGNWSVGGQSYPAWTWAGPYSLSSDPCSECACNMSLNLYTNISPCPVEGRTISLGPAFNDQTDPTKPGGLLDNCGCNGPLNASPDTDFKTIRYAVKTVDKDLVAPGDTLNFTVYYGLPGLTTPSSIVIMDSLPLYTHYVEGSASPAPLSDWAPNPGPPMRLKWNLTTTMLTTGGPTSELRFSFSVDWGGEYCIDNNAGYVAAPELARLLNSAQVFWEGSSCGSPTTAVTPQTQSVVRRYLFWKTADNDALMAPRVGLPDDMIVYEIYIKNISTTKTWYNVRFWDTVPPELDNWLTDCGFYDPCLGGYTMTPTGCTPASPGYVLGTDTTLLTWNFDLPPAQTLSVKWKAKVKPSVPSGGQTINIVSLQAMGAQNCFSGATGNAQTPRIFTHVAPILLRTSYNTYVTNFANALLFGKCEDYGFWIAFYPLNKETDFTLYRREHFNDVFANDGGVSLPIDVMTGTCRDGFSGNIGGTGAGCREERAPALYKPSWWWGAGCTFPYAQLYKLVSNSPLIWEYDMEAGGTNADGETFTGSTSLSFAGFSHYTFRRSCCGLDDIDGTLMDNYGNGDQLIIFNTGMLPDNTFSATRPTTIHLFKWDSGLKKFIYQKTRELDGESLWMDDRTNYADRGHWKIMSSDTKLIIHKTYFSTGEHADNGFSGGRDFATPTPFRRTGNLASLVADDTTYFKAAGPRDQTPNMSVGNMGTQAATYELWKYMPNFPSTDGTDGVPMYLGGTSGKWIFVTTDVVKPGLNPVAAVDDNPHMYGPAPGMSQGVINTRPSGAYKINVLAGGPIQVITGDSAFSGYSGGAMLHAAVPVGEQTGSEFWVHQTVKDMINDCEELYTMVFSCPIKGTQCTLETTGGVTATYTTTAVDQAISFQLLSVTPLKHNYRMRLGTPGSVVAQYVMCQHGDAKFFTAPFLKKGTFYTLIAPPVVFAGQPFWLTVVVTTDIGTTKTEYCGTSYLTSTDPTAVFGAPPANEQQYVWSSTTGCSDPPDENGVRLFVGITMNKLGQHTIVGNDLNDGTITGLAALTVVGANVKFTKEPRLALASSGDIVSFRICWSNYASSSAFDFTITDAVPMGTDFVAQTADDTKCSIPAGVAVDTAYSTVTPPVYSTTTGLIPPGTRWLKWTVKEVGVNSSGCVCFKVTVN